MGSVSVQINQEIMNDDEDGVSDSVAEDQMMSLNLRYSKNGEGTDKKVETCIMNEHFSVVQTNHGVTGSLVARSDRAESYNQRGNPGHCIYDDSTKEEAHNQCLNHEVHLGKRISVSLDDGIYKVTNKFIDNGTSGEASILKEKCGDIVMVEMISHGLVPNNHSSLSHYKSAVSKTDAGIELDISSIHVQNDQQVLNKDDGMYDKCQKQAKLTAGAVENFETYGSHEPSSLSNGQQCESNCLLQSNAENRHQNNAGNFRTMQRSDIDINRRLTPSSDDDDSSENSENLCHLMVTFDKEQQVKSEALYHSDTSKSTTAQAANSVTQGANSESIIEAAPDVEEVTDSPATVSERILIKRDPQRTPALVTDSLIKRDPQVTPALVTDSLIKRDPQVTPALVTDSLIKSDTLKQTSSDDSVHMQALCNVMKPSLSLTKQNEALLNFLRQNGVKASGYHDSALTVSPCKVLTKYVFINKSSNYRSIKKRFGVLYKQTFRHYGGAKLKKKNAKSVVQQKKTKKESTNKQVLDRKNKLVSIIHEENSPRKQTREARYKSREERMLAWEIKNNTCKDLNKKMNEKNKQKIAPKKRRKKKENKTERLHSEKVRTKSLKEGKQKKNFQKSQSVGGKLTVIKPMDNPQESCNFVGKENGISKTHMKILKKQREFLDEAKNRIPSEGKRNKIQRKIHLEKADVEIKQEITDGDVNDNQHLDSIIDKASPFQQRKSKMRNRKDLTLQEKVQAIRALEMTGSKFVAVAKKFGVSVSAISRINRNKEYILLQYVSGDLNNTQRRSRDCKDPELDKVLLRWYRAIEHLHLNDKPITISNVLLKEKAHDLAITMGKNYFPSDNWIIRWKNRHNIGSKSNIASIMIQDREEFKQLDNKVNISEVLEEMGKQEFKIDQVKQESLLKRKKAEEIFTGICEHCGVLTRTKKKENNHLTGCPASSFRKDLTLEEKVQVVRALEQPGVKMVALAKKYGVSASAISRIHKNRVDILARRASGLANSARRRDRSSKEPEVEKALCEWFKVQHELGIHISGSMIREKARDIAKVMGKDFSPSESWVFRWRHRNNVTNINTFLYGDSDESELEGLERNNDNVEEVTFPNSSEDCPAGKRAECEEDAGVDAVEGMQSKKRRETTSPDGSAAAKQFRLPRSVMCEKCGFVSCRVKNNRIKSLRHAKGCPDLKPRNELTYENRARMLKALEEPGATLSSVARQFGVSVSSMSRMNQKKDQILTHSEGHATQKRIRDCKEPEVAYTLYQWYMEKKTEGVHVTGPKLKEKAKKIAAELGREFNASSGWLGRWRHRYNIISGQNKIEKIPPKYPAKKRRLKGNGENKMDSSEHLQQLQVMPSELHEDSLSSAGSVIVEPLEPIPVSQAPQNTPSFIHQRFQNPWEIIQQQADSCVWTKEFLTPAGPSVLDETAVSVAYTYGDTVSKPVFHNMFDSFSAVGYQVTMPIDSNIVVSREYLKSDISEDKCGPSGAHLPHASHLSHIQHCHHLPTNLTAQQHLQQHIPVTHSLTHSHQSQIQPHLQMTHPLPLPSPAAVEDDPEQHRQVMEAFKIISSFAQKKSLGDQVQTALRTIEMSVKSSTRQPSTRNTYTSI